MSIALITAQNAHYILIDKLKQISSSMYIACEAAVQLFNNL